jgi:predicted transcriptional regulator
MAAGEARIHEFPPFPVASISDIEYSMLGVMRDRTDGVSSIKELKERLDDKLGKVTPRSNVKYYLDNLQKMGLVRTERDKKELNIKLTKVGELFADSKSEV